MDQAATGVNMGCSLVHHRSPNINVKVGQRSVIEDTLSCSQLMRADLRSMHTLTSEQTVGASPKRGQLQ